MISETDPAFCLVTRFSFFGKSGCKSEFSRDAALLFDEDRLRLRIDLMRRVNLQSLRVQTDEDFHLFVLTSSDLPKWAGDELRRICAEILPDERVSIVAAPPSPARKPLRLFTARRYGGRPHVQIALDDDDGLSSDFVATVRSELAGIDPAEGLPRFLTFPTGFGVDWQDEGPANVFVHSRPYINLGLTMVTTSERKNILAIDHQGTPPRYGCRVCREDVPMFVRTVHGANDSRVAVRSEWVPVADPAANVDITARFPWLLGR